jgi:hypothetical protein
MGFNIMSSRPWWLFSWLQLSPKQSTPVSKPYHAFRFHSIQPPTKHKSTRWYSSIYILTCNNKYSHNRKMFYQTAVSSSPSAFSSARCRFHFLVCDQSKYTEPAVNVGKEITIQYFFKTGQLLSNCKREDNIIL